MVWVEPEHLTFTSRESVAFFLHERHEVPCDVGVTFAFDFFFPVVVARGALEAFFVEILEGLLLEIDVVPFHDLVQLFATLHPSRPDFRRGTRRGLWFPACIRSG